MMIRYDAPVIHLGGGAAGRRAQRAVMIHPSLRPPLIRSQGPPDEPLCSSRRVIHHALDAGSKSPPTHPSSSSSWESVSEGPLWLHPSSFVMELARALTHYSSRREREAGRSGPGRSRNHTHTHNMMDGSPTSFYQSIHYAPADDSSRHYKMDRLPPSLSLSLHYKTTVKCVCVRAATSPWRPPSFDL